jgi:trimeric autotransporter adhesin
VSFFFLFLVARSLPQPARPLFLTFPSPSTKHIHPPTPSHLAVLLFSAERTWAQAQARKAGLGAAEAPTGAVRKGLVSRAHRAARWAADLARLAGGGEGVATTPRTAVEAAAYAAWLDGVARSERGGDWGAALGALARARVLTDALARAGPADARAAARAQLVDLDPALRFAQYQLGRVGGGGSADGGAAAVEAAAEKARAALAAEPGLAAALAAVAAEGGGDAGGDDASADASAGAATGFAVFEWRGASYPVGSERVRSTLGPAAAACAKAAAAAAAAAAADASPSSASTSSAGARIAALDAAIAALGRAKGAARQAAASAGGAGGAGGPADAADARALALALSGAQLERALERGALVVAGLTARLDAGLAAAAAASAGGGGGRRPAVKKDTPATTPPLRRARPEELMRAYDGLAKAAKALGEVAASLGGSVGELLGDEAAAAAAGAAAGRAYAAGHAFLAARKPADAFALFGRAVDRADAAVDAHAECARPDAGATAALDALATAAGVWRGVAHAQAAAAEAAALGAVTGRVSGLEISADGAASGDGGQAALPPPPTFLSDGPTTASLSEWASFAPPGGPPRLAPLPPRLEAVPVRPFVLDLAFDGVVAPDLSHRVAAGGAGGGAGGDGGGTFAKLFSWRR